MRRRWIRRVLWGSLISAAVVVAALFVAPPLGRELQHRRMEAAIARFQASPSRAGVDELTRLLAEGLATLEQRKRILKIVFYPKVIARPAYPFDAPVVISVERPFTVRFKDVGILEELEFWVDGKVQATDGIASNDFFNDYSRSYSVRTQLDPGLHRGEVRLKYTGTLPPAKTSWHWNPMQGRFPRSLLPYKTRTLDYSAPGQEYTCEFSVPVELKLVTRAEAKKVDLLTHPELDKRMHSAISASTSNQGGAYVTRTRKWNHTGDLTVRYSHLPVAVAFKATLRLANGEELPQLEHPYGSCRARAGASGYHSITPWMFPLKEAGQYHATVVLTPDPEDACQDPAIKAIWNATLEFPVSFTVTAVPESDAPSQR